MKALDGIEQAGREIMQVSLAALLSVVFRKDLGDTGGQVLGVPFKLLPGLSGVLALVAAFLIIKFIFLVVEYRSRDRESELSDFLSATSQARVNLTLEESLGVVPWHVADARNRAESQRAHEGRTHAFAKVSLEVIVFLSPIFVGLLTIVIVWEDITFFLQKIFAH